MKLRFYLYRMGAYPEITEIEEAVELVRLYNDERVQTMCPFMEQSKR